MKKLVAALLLALMCVGAQAQIVTSRSSYQTIEREQKVRTPLKLEWYAKLGLNLMQANPNNPYYISGPHDNVSGNKMRVGFNLGFGMLSHFRPSNPSDFYWGAELGVTQEGGGWDAYQATDEGSIWTSIYDYPEVSFTKFAAYLGPIIGWKKPIFGDIQLDIHISPQIAVPFGEDIEVPCTRTEIWGTGDIDTYNEYEYVYLGLPQMAIQGGVGVWINKFIVDFSYRHCVITSDQLKPSNIMLSVGYNF